MISLKQHLKEQIRDPHPVKWIILKEWEPYYRAKDHIKMRIYDEILVTFSILDIKIAL